MMKIGPYYWLRVGVMIITLITILFLMFRLNNPPSGGGSTGSVQLCPTRVSSISVIGKAALMQDELKWYRVQEGQRQLLDQVAVEKWFSRYCRVQAEPVGEVTGENQPVMTLAYVAGLPATLMQTEDGVFTFGGHHFHSQQLTEAIQALLTLPESTRPSHEVQAR